MKKGAASVAPFFVFLPKNIYNEKTIFIVDNRPISRL